MATSSISDNPPPLLNWLDGEHLHTHLYLSQAEAIPFPSGAELPMSSRAASTAACCAPPFLFVP